MRKIILLFFVVTIALFNNGIGSAEGPKNYLKGKFYSSVKDHFLIATEKMKDNRFSKTVIVMLESDENGAWGLAINKRLGIMPIALLIDASISTPEEREELGSRGREHVKMNYNFENFQKQWVETMLDVHEKHGSWENRKNYKPYEF